LRLMYQDLKDEQKQEIERVKHPFFECTN
jgi:hypothetical protein